MTNVEKFNTLTAGVVIFLSILPQVHDFYVFWTVDPWRSGLHVTLKCHKPFTQEHGIITQNNDPQHTEDVGSRFLWNVGTHLLNYQEAIILEMLYFTILH